MWPTGKRRESGGLGLKSGLYLTRQCHEIFNLFSGSKTRSGPLGKRLKGLSKILCLPFFYLITSSCLPIVSSPGLGRWVTPPPPPQICWLISSEWRLLAEKLRDGKWTTEGFHGWYRNWDTNISSGIFYFRVVPIKICTNYLHFREKNRQKHREDQQIEWGYRLGSCYLVLLEC